MWASSIKWLHIGIDMYSVSIKGQTHLNTGLEMLGEGNLLLLMAAWAYSIVSYVFEKIQ